MVNYCTNENILTVDPNAAQLLGTPEDPDFTSYIIYVSLEIDELLRNTYPDLVVGDLETTTQLMPLCVHMVLEMLYVNSNMGPNDAAQYKADYHRKMASSLMKRKLDLINGEKTSIGIGRCVRC